MTEIIILCGGAEARAREIAALYDGGNRVHVTAIIADPAQTEEVAAGTWLVCDRWHSPLAPEVETRFPGRVIMLADDRTAPEAAVDILNAVRQSESRAADTERQWADRLGIKPAVTPPPIPAGVRRKEAAPPTDAGVHHSAAQPQSPGVQTHPVNGNARNETSDEPPMPSTYIVWAVVMTILCCMPAGIVAIIFGSQVSSRYYNGDYEGAQRASHRAEIWIIVSFVLGVLTQTLYLPMIIAGWL